MMEKASTGSADRVVLDLEDAVTPEQKPRARDQVVRAIEEFDWDEKIVSVRINGLDTEYCYADVVTLIEAVGNALDLIVVPKPLSGRDVFWIDTLLTQVEENVGVDEPVGLEALIEECEGLENVEDIAAASNRLESLVFGTGDFSASRGIVQPSARPGGSLAYDGDFWHYARNKVLNAARVNGLLAYEGVVSNFEDPDTLRDTCREVKTLGFDGYEAIHPGQVGIINEVFSPDESDIEYARTVLELLDEAEEEGAGAVNFEGIMLDQAHRRYANKILDQAAAYDLL